MLPYDITEHRHRFSVWAAARATQRGFSDIVTLRKAIEDCGVVEFLKTANLEDVNAARFDEHHRQWCSSVVDSLEKADIRNASFGRAAKLIAVYIKSIVVLSSRSQTLLAHVAHPPIDSILLRNLAASEVVSEHKRHWAKIKWTKLSGDKYKDLIQQLRQVLGPGEPFWMLERFWTVTNRAR